MEDKPLTVVAQMTGMRSLATGGWRVTIDLFQNRLTDYRTIPHK